MSGNYLFWPTLTLIIGFLAWLVGTKLRRGSLLSPYSLMLLILVSIFGVRPLLMPDEPKSFGFYGIDISLGFEDATFLGFVGTISFVVGALSWRLLVARKQEPLTTTDLTPVQPWAPRRSVVIAWSLSIGWLLLMIVVGGGVGFLAQLFGGRSEAVISKLENVPAFVGALPAIGCLVIATVRFRYERLQPYTKSQNIAYWLVAIGSIVPPSALGTRRYLIPCVIIALMGTLSNHWQKRIKPSWIVVGVVAFVALAILPFVRSAGSRTARGEADLVGAMGAYFQDVGLRGTLNNFFLSYDTEMFNYVAYMTQTMGKTIPFGMGRGTIGELITMPLPAAITPFQRWADYLLTQSFGANCGYQSACPVPSIVGILYSDLALPGLVVGMLILGIMAARFERHLMASDGTMTGVLLLTAGFAVAFARGNSLAQVWIAVQCFIVWWVVQRLFLHSPKVKAKASQPQRQTTQMPTTTPIPDLLINRAGPRR
ncbi:hypothetical protein [Arthrobacter sp. M2012083]|uniref:hypothetical protein n=1 Tax=Arthrobacter sp. M2012083 TaxID=1197706 RepID=UPI00030ECB4B|nr:hypothetical protein [Arthrobacter sp. M2012083]